MADVSEGHHVVTENMMLTLYSALKSGKYSDFTITCGGDTYNVHKAVVCTKSGFFERAERFNGQQVSDFSSVDGITTDERHLSRMSTK